MLVLFQLIPYTIRITSYAQCCLTTFPHTQPHFAITRIATFGHSIFCDFTLFFSVAFNLHTEKLKKAVSRTLNRVRDLAVKNQSVQIGCQMCRVRLLAFSPVSAYRKMSVQGIYSKRSSANYPRKCVVLGFLP